MEQLPSSYSVLVTVHISFHFICTTACEMRYCFCVLDEETGPEKVRDGLKFPDMAYGEQTDLSASELRFLLLQGAEARGSLALRVGGGRSSAPGSRKPLRDGGLHRSCRQGSFKGMSRVAPLRLSGLRLVSAGPHANGSQPSKQGSGGPGHMHVSSESSTTFSENGTLGVSLQDISLLS